MRGRDFRSQVIKYCLISSPEGVLGEQELSSSPGLSIFTAMVISLSTKAGPVRSATSRAWRFPFHCTRVSDQHQQSLLSLPMRELGNGVSYVPLPLFIWECERMFVLILLIGHLLVFLFPPSLPPSLPPFLPLSNNLFIFFVYFSIWILRLAVLFLKFL